MSKRKTPRARPNPWQQELLDQLKALAAGHRQDLRVTGHSLTGPGGPVVVPFTVRTGEMPQGPGGLPVGEVEDLILVLPSTPRIPPWVQTTHTRFAGTPHVLQGNRLCIYLDAAREWDPAAGIAPVMNRLWEWLADAAAGKFDPDTALYHPVGGILHHTPGAPTVVVREPVPHHSPGTGWLTPRSPDRLDLTGRSADAHSHRTPILPVNHSLPLGAGSTLAELVTLIDSTNVDISASALRTGPASEALLTALAASALRNLEGAPQHFVLTVKHPATLAAPPFLLAGRLQPQASDTLRLLARRRIPSHLGTLPDELRQAAIEWCYLSDERPEVTTRRDAQRPVHAFHGAHVHVWGCGGIGSWAAELVTRAGASRLTLSDPGRITGGLLVRQNYTENNIGLNKAAALAQRLRSIRDDLVIDIADPLPNSTLFEAADHADLIIDATVSAYT
ncbi:ThiF family adenylyltransferase [Streptomyces niveus]|uniref:ThiF family adenylyltransferase n=1 Tax=Streptomyces niveus TaxID=193462 RepID=UPI00362BED89